MVPLCSLVALCPCQGSGFLFPLLTVPSGCFPSILRFSPHLTTSHHFYYLTPSYVSISYYVSFHHPRYPFCSPILRLPSVRFGKWLWSSEGQVFHRRIYELWESRLGVCPHSRTGTELGLKRCCFNSRSVFLERPSPLLQLLFG